MGYVSIVPADLEQLLTRLDKIIELLERLNNGDKTN